ncbi:uncharacterized protein LOC121803424 [Salvia splendens]|uniref:uncharacterized protein LOC121803424 n=1 Tax=Salvia splendens TaxID=180675 RepID=UPI001C25521B|nr:uncharacterized protein LOC121803424 [Salvia splendens]
MMVKSLILGSLDWDGGQVGLSFTVLIWVVLENNYKTRNRGSSSFCAREREKGASDFRRFLGDSNDFTSYSDIFRSTSEIMAPFITCVINLSKAITTSTIKVRCVRAFQGLPEDKNDKSLECVFHDSKVDNLCRICKLAQSDF